MTYYIDKRLSLTGFDDLCIAFIIKARRRLFPNKKQNPFPITKNILEKIMENELLLIIDFNIDTTFKVA